MYTDAITRLQNRNLLRVDVKTRGKRDNTVLDPYAYRFRPLSWSILFATFPRGAPSLVLTCESGGIALFLDVSSSTCTILHVSFVGFYIVLAQYVKSCMWCSGSTCTEALTLFQRVPIESMLF